MKGFPGCAGIHELGYNYHGIMEIAIELIFRVTVKGYPIIFC
jgi:hypothetical protein